MAILPSLGDALIVMENIVKINKRINVCIFEPIFCLFDYSRSIELFFYIKVL